MRPRSYSAMCGDRRPANALWPVDRYIVLSCWSLCMSLMFGCLCVANARSGARYRAVPARCTISLGRHAPCCGAQNRIAIHPSAALSPIAHVAADIRTDDDVDDVVVALEGSPFITQQAEPLQSTPAPPRVRRTLTTACERHTHGQRQRQQCRWIVDASRLTLDVSHDASAPASPAATATASPTTTAAPAAKRGVAGEMEVSFAVSPIASARGQPPAAETAAALAVVAAAPVTVQPRATPKRAALAKDIIATAKEVDWDAFRAQQLSWRQQLEQQQRQLEQPAVTRAQPAAQTAVKPRRAALAKDIVAKAKEIDWDAFHGQRQVTQPQPQPQPVVTARGVTSKRASLARQIAVTARKLDWDAFHAQQPARAAGTTATAVAVDAAAAAAAPLVLTSPSVVAAPQPRPRRAALAKDIAATARRMDWEEFHQKQQQPLQVQTSSEPQAQPQPTRVAVATSRPTRAALARDIAAKAKEIDWGRLPRPPTLQVAAAAAESVPAVVSVSPSVVASSTTVTPLCNDVGRRRPATATCRVGA